MQSPQQGPNDSQERLAATISVVMAAHDEASLITECIESVRSFATEIIVVDGQSTDGTADIARAYGAEVIETDNKLMLNVNKNIGIDAATGDWILVIDPDERIPPGLANELFAIANNEESADAWWIPRRNFVLGRWIRHMGMYPDPQLRFFRQGIARFPCRDIHEMVEFHGLSARTTGDMTHLSPPPIWHYVQKRNLYSEHRAQHLRDQGVRFRVYKLLTRPMWAFVKPYFLRGGWREGLTGLIICVSAAYGTFLQDAKLWQKWQEGFADEPLMMVASEPRHAMSAPSPPRRNVRFRSSVLRPVRRPLLAAWRRGWLPAPKMTVRARLADGRQMDCDISDRTQRRMLVDAYEPRETQVVSTLLGPGKRFVDVGAHIGWFTTLAGTLVGAEGRVDSFEPFPSNAKRLRDNVGLNRLEQVKIHTRAVSDQVGSVTIGVQASSDSGSATLGSRSAEHLTEVPTVSLDVALDDDDPIDLLKIDAEGFELHVLRGAQRVLKRSAAVLIELNRSALLATGADPLAVVAEISANGLTHHALIIDDVVSPLDAGVVLPDFANLVASRTPLTLQIDGA